MPRRPPLTRGLTRVDAFVTLGVAAVQRDLRGTDVPKWRNWQTRVVQVHVLARVWGFESLLRHQIFRVSSLRHLTFSFTFFRPLTGGRRRSSAPVGSLAPQPNNASIETNSKEHGLWQTRLFPSISPRKSKGNGPSRKSLKFDSADCPRVATTSVGTANPASAALTRKRAELGYVAAGGKIEPAENGSEDDKRTKVTAAIAEYFADCRDRQGKSGYGLSVRTVEAYEGRLARLVEFQPGAYLDQINGEFIRKFRRFLREHPDDLSDRSCYNIMQAVSTFLTRNNILVARPFLKEMSYPPTEVITYTDVELATFFAACDEKEKLLFKFFLHSMARDMEVAHTEVRDLYFQKNVQECASQRVLSARLHELGRSGLVG